MKLCLGWDQQFDELTDSGLFLSGRKLKSCRSQLLMYFQNGGMRRKAPAILVKRDQAL